MSTVEKLSIIQEDPWLDTYTNDVSERYQRYVTTRKHIEDAEGSLSQIHVQLISKVLKATKF